MICFSSDHANYTHWRGSTRVRKNYFESLKSIALKIIKRFAFCFSPLLVPLMPMRILASSELLKGRLTNLGKVTTMTTATTQEKIKRPLSERGVDSAEKLLERKGLKIIAKNWTCDEGLIDLVCEDDDVLVFVEIKTRRLVEGVGFPEDVISKSKRERVERMAAEFLKTYDKVDVQVRFDIIAILVISDDRAFLRHHINAFGI